MWPDIPFAQWRSTRDALHVYLQIAGKYRLARAPWQNHSWHAIFYLTGRGVTTSPIPDGPGGIEINFDFLDHRVEGTATDGARGGFALEPMSVAAFHGRFLDLVRGLGGNPEFHDRPSELPDPIRFADDREQRPYDREAVTRFFHALVSADRVLKRFRTSFLGKASPVHLFWGALDLVVTRFSGRRAPLHPGGMPGLPDPVVREAYSHEVSSCGFWPGDDKYPAPAFYCYAYPEPPGFKDWKVQPAAARYDATMQEFILPYDAVRTAADPEAEVMQFLQSSYEAAAVLGDWDRAAFECAPGQPGIPRAVDPLP